MSFLETLRQKPRATKERYAFVSAVAVTLIIGSFWALSLPARFASVGSHVSPSEEQTADTESGFGELFGTAKEQWGAVIESIEDAPVEQDNTGALSGLTGEEYEGGNPDTATTTSAAGSTDDAEILQSPTTTTTTPTTPPPKVILIGTTTTHSSE